MKNKLVKRLTKLLSEDKIEEAINELQVNISDPHPEWLVNLSAQLRNLKSEISAGSVSQQVAIEIRNRIRSSLLRDLKENRILKKKKLKKQKSSLDYEDELSKSNSRNEAVRTVLNAKNIQRNEGNINVQDNTFN